jgi:hypothetical protein
MYISIIDWSILVTQTAFLLIFIAVEFFRKHNRNLYVIYIFGTTLVLVQGQAFWVFDYFSSGFFEIRHLLQVISIQGVKLANLYTFLFTLSLIISYSICYSNTKKIADQADNTKYFRSKIYETPIFYGLVLAWVLISAWLLINLLGGIQTIIYNPGALVPGQTVLLIALSLGKLPLLRKLVLGFRVNLIEIMLFLIAFLLILFNSRFYAAFIVIQIFFIVNYCQKELSRSVLLIPAIILIFIFFVYGLYREYQNYYDDITFENMTTFISNIPFGGVSNWFYGGNVEGFVGFAGILTYEHNQGGIQHDFGISNLSLFTQLLPNAIRNSETFKPLTDFLESFYPYPLQSIVAPGLENAYAHFGLFGVIGLGILLGFLAQWLHIKMTSRNVDRLGVGVLSVHSVLLVRGTFRAVLFFMLAEFVILGVYRFFLRFGIWLTPKREVSRSVVKL